MNDAILNLALSLAQTAAKAGETPIGAVIFKTDTNEVVASAHNLVVTDNDPSAHAEVLAIRTAGHKLGNYNLSGYSIFSTLEPCAMCGCAISWAKIDALYFGAYDAKSGAIEHGPRLYQFATCHHKPAVYGGIGETKCAQALKDFFKGLRI